jgi:putative membrane protein
MKCTALWRGLLPLAVALASVMAACEGRNDDESMDGAYEGVNETETAQPPAGGAALTDEDIIAQIRQVNTMDSTLGRLAAQKGTNRQVKEYGQRMAREHGSAQQQVNQVAQQLNMGGTAQGTEQGGDRQRMGMGTSNTGMMNGNHGQQMRDSLQAMARGAEWDRAYVTNEVTAHEQALELLTRAENSTQRPEIKDLINKLSPVVQDHLTKAREMQQQMQSGTAGQKNQNQQQY